MIGAGDREISDVDVKDGVEAIARLTLATASSLHFGFGGNHARRARVGLLHRLREGQSSGKRAGTHGLACRRRRSHLLRRCRLGSGGRGICASQERPGTRGANRGFTEKKTPALKTK